MNKAKILLIGLAVMAFLLPGCRKNEKGDAERISAQRFAAFCRIGDNSYYSQRNADGLQFLYYYDAKTKQAAPLCGKPECTHDDPECSACIGNAIGVSGRGEHIYWVTPEFNSGDDGYILYRMNADGTKRKKLRKLSKINENVLPTGNFMALYDSKNAYFCGNRTNILDGEEIQTTALYCCPQEAEEMRVLYEEQELRAPVIQIYKNHLYLSLTRQSVTEENGDYILSSDFSLRRYDMENWEEEILFRGELDFVPYGFFVLDDRILITAVSSGNSRVFAYDFEKKTIEAALKFGEGDEYEVLYVDDNRVVGYTYPDFPDFSRKKVKVTDFEGKVLLEAESEEKMHAADGTRVYGRTYLGSDETGLFFSYEDTESEPGKILQRVVRVELSDGSEKELTGE